MPATIHSCPSEEPYLLYVNTGGLPKKFIKEVWKCGLESHGVAMYLLVAARNKRYGGKLAENKQAKLNQMHIDIYP